MHKLNNRSLTTFQQESPSGVIAGNKFDYREGNTKGNDNYCSEDCLKQN